MAENQPTLLGVRILVTRASEQAGETAKALRARGAVPVEVPTIVLGPPDDPAPLARAVRSLEHCDAIALTSANAVDALFRALTEASLDATALAGRLVAVVGPATAKALERHGVRPDLVAKEHHGEGLAVELLAALARGPDAEGGLRKRVLLPRAQVARDALPDALRAAGIEVDVVAAYKSSPPGAAEVSALARRLDVGEIDAVLLTSSSTAENLCALLPDAPRRLARVVVGSIGPLTSETCRRLGVHVDVEAAPSTLPSLLDALAATFAARRPAPA